MGRRNHYLALVFCVSIIGALYAFNIGSVPTRDFHAHAAKMQALLGSFRSHHKAEFGTGHLLGGVGSRGGNETMGGHERVQVEVAHPRSAAAPPPSKPHKPETIVDLFKMKEQPGECAKQYPSRGSGDRPRWPLYKVSEHTPSPSDKGLMPDKTYVWGQAPPDPKFEEVKFYIYEGGVFDMRAAEECFARRHNLPSPLTDPLWFNQLDKTMSIVNREYFPEIMMLHAYRAHKQRTMDPEEASIFVIPYSPAIMIHSHPCAEMEELFKNITDEAYHSAWDKVIAKELKQSKYYQRNGGKDHIHSLTFYKGMPSPDYAEVLQQGAKVLTVERYLVPLHSQLPKSYDNDDVIIIPYVSSTYTDAAAPPDIRPLDTYDKSKWWFFRGNMQRRGEGLSRAHLPELGELLGGADFVDARPNTKNQRTPLLKMVEATAHEMRESPICLVPEGDSPTSLRLFEALAVGCLPVVMGDKAHMRHVLPFPNLINWDSIALFMQGLGDVGQCKTGLKEMAETLNAVMGPGVDRLMAQKIHDMRVEGARAFRNHFSYFRNPDGVATSVLYEAWMALQVSKPSQTKNPGSLIQDPAVTSSGSAATVRPDQVDGSNLAADSVDRENAELRKVPVGSWKYRRVPMEEYKTDEQIRVAHDKARPSSKVAFMITILDEVKDNNLDMVVVLAQSIHKALHEKGTVFVDYDLVAVIGGGATHESASALERLGWKVLSKEVPVKVAEIAPGYLKEHIGKDGCCGEKELLKLWAFTLTEYYRVVHVDIDVIFLRNIDRLLAVDVECIYTIDINMATGNEAIPPVQGGFFIIRPSMIAFDTFVKIVKEGDYREGTGWEGALVGWCYGGKTVQGLFAYYYGLKAKPELSLEVDRCIFNSMFDRQKQGECMGVGVGQGGPDNQGVVSVHFTGCQKPTNCPDNETCRPAHKKWKEIRKEAEIRMGLEPSETCPSGRYIPMNLANVSVERW